MTADLDFSSIEYGWSQLKRAAALHRVFKAKIAHIDGTSETQYIRSSESDMSQLQSSHIKGVQIVHQGVTPLMQIVLPRAAASVSSEYFQKTHRHIIRLLEKLWNNEARFRNATVDPWEALAAALNNSSSGVSSRSSLRQLKKRHEDSYSQRRNRMKNIKFSVFGEFFP